MNAPAPELLDVRHDWTREEIAQLFALPFADLVFRAQTVHRRYFDANEVQISTLLSIKTGGCPEDCGYCSQSASHETGLKASKLMEIDAVLADARAARAAGATRFCMGAAWRSPKDKDLDAVCAMVEGVKALGMETCVTLGMLTQAQAERLGGAGLDYYNHNIDTSPEYYREIVTTRNFEDRLDTLGHVRAAGIHVCCGGIVGLGEVAGTPLGDSAPLDPLDFVRTVAAARIAMPRSMVRLSAGRGELSDEAQALCFLAGANAIFHGDKLLTTPNPEESRDDRLFAKLGLRAMA